jgi:hypothetical protein
VTGSGVNQPRNRRAWLLVILLLTSVGLVGPVWAEEPERVTVPLLDSPVRGPADAPVTMIEFVDFQ